MKIVADEPSERRTDGPTDKPSYRYAMTHLVKIVTGGIRHLWRKDNGKTTTANRQLWQKGSANVLQLSQSPVNGPRATGLLGGSARAKNEDLLWSLFCFTLFS